MFGEQGVEAGEEFGGGSVESGQALRESVESGVEGGGQLGRAGDQAAEVPHGETGRDRRHATEAAGDSQVESGPAQAEGHGGDGAHRDRGGGADLAVRGEHPGEHRHHLAHAGDQPCLGRSAQVGTCGDECFDLGDVFVESGELRGGHPGEHEAVDPGDDLGVVVVGAWDVGGQARLGAEEAHVDQFGCHTRGAGAHEAGDAQVEVHVAAEDLEHDLVAVVDLFQVDGEAGHEIAHAHVAGAVPGVVGGQR